MPTSKAISASKFLGKDKYEHYLNELLTENTLGGQQLSKAQIKEAFSKRKNKISFEKFVDKVISTKTARAAFFPGTGPVLGPAGGGLGPKGGALVKSPIGALATYKKLQISADQKEVGGVGGYLKDIIGSLGNIIKVLNAGVSADIKNQEQKRRDRERSKRESVEKGLEKGFSAVKKIIEKVVAPVKSILSKIIDFFVKMFLARVVVKLIDWLADPKNASKVKSVIRFLGDWWPALLGSYILFGTSFGRFVRGVTGLLARFIVQIGKVAIPGLLKFIAKNPAGAAAAALFGVGAAAELVPGMTGQQEQKTKQAPGSTEDKIKALQQQKANLNIFQKMQGVGSEIDEQIFALQSGGAKSYGFAGGGFNGFVSGEKGVDKIPAMLSDGEFVMSVGAVQKYGVDTLEAMNAAGGGTNKPKVMGGKVYAAGGGSIGSERYSLSPGFSGESSQSDIYLIRAVNELIKVLRNKFSNSGTSGPSGSSGGSGLPQQLSNIAEQIASRGSQIYQGASSIANRGIAATSSISNRGVDLARRAAGVAAEKAKPLMEKAKPLIQSLPATMDYGSLYLRSQLGGLGGSITEADLSKQTLNEYAKAFAVAKTRAAQRRAGVESSIRMYQGFLRAQNLTAQQKAEFEKQLKVNQSRLEKYKKGQIDVQYADFADKNGRVSPAARAAQKTMGAVWATSTKDGGVQIEKEPYDFPIVNDPWGLINWPNMNKKQRQDWLNKQPLNSPHKRQLEQNPNAWGKQKIAEALYSLNPFATPVETDVKIGGNPRAKGIVDALINAVDNPLMSMSRGLMMNLLKGRERNVITGEAEKGSLWDKMFPKPGPPLPKPGQSSGAVTMYKPNDPRRRNTGQSYQSRFARPINSGPGSVKPPLPKTTVVRVSGSGGSRGSASSSRNQFPRTTGSPGGIRASHPSGTANRQANLNIRNK